MITRTAPAPRVVIYEGDGARPLEDGQRFDLMLALLEKGHAVTSTRAGGQVSGPGDRPGTMIVLGRFDDNRFENTDGASGDLEVHVRDIEAMDTPAVLDAVEAARGQAEGAKPKSWKPWFPVIDYDRCTNCMQCMSFCLFDVYGVSKEGKINVQNQDNCKTDCPACSRVCPEVAILFPKYRFGPINGDVVNPEDLRREAMKVDISALLGGDIYAALRDRSEKAKSRFSKERDEDRALKERNRCLTKLQQNLGALDIPAEVLASLPSPDQIKVKAQEAKARAQAAIALADSQGGVASAVPSSAPQPPSPGGPS